MKREKEKSDWSKKEDMTKKYDMTVRWKRGRERIGSWIELVMVVVERKGPHGWKIYKRLEEIWVDADGKSEEN